MTLTTEQIKRITAVISDTTFYCQHSDGEENETMRVRAYDEDELVVYCVGEESDDDYVVDYDEIDLDKDLFYTLVKMDMANY